MTPVAIPCCRVQANTLDLCARRALGIGEIIWLAAELFEDNAIFFLKVFDHRLLVLIDPAGDGDQEELKLRRHGNQ